jgi:YggT family protein
MSGDLLGFIGWLLQIFGYLIFARAMTSWFPSARHHPIIQLLYQITDPVMIPASKLIPRIGMIDLSHMIVLLTLFYVSNKLMGG